MIMQDNVFIGVGQFGNYVARELEQLGYKVFYINSAREDLERIGALGLENTHLIKGAKGCMKDRALAKEYALDSIEAIINQINSEYSNETVYNFIFSSGGGTGSGVTPTLMGIMKDYYDYKIINAITTTPHEIDITINGNSAICLSEINELQKSGVINSIHILNNDNFTDNVGKINAIFASTLDKYNSITEEIALMHEDKENIIKGSEGDSGEFGELFNDKGITVMLELDHEDNSESFVEELTRALNNSIYATWIKDCNNLGFYTTKNMQNQDNISLLTSEFGIPYKTHTGTTQEGTFIIATGMSWNENIQKKLAKQSVELENARTEQIKKQKQELEKESFEDIDLNALKTKLSQNSSTNLQRKNSNASRNNRQTKTNRMSASQRLQESLAKYRNK
ncbi:hypothetical protein FDF26_13860 [Clostridium botulinum]|nr:hypothetical protein [Clostridium botulinum]